MSEDCIHGWNRTFRNDSFVTALLPILIRLTAEMEVFKYACVFVPVVDA